MLSIAVIGHVKGGSFDLLMPDTLGHNHKFPSDIFDHTT